MADEEDRLLEELRQGKITIDEYDGKRRLIRAGRNKEKQYDLEAFERKMANYNVTREAKPKRILCCSWEGCGLFIILIVALLGVFIGVLTAGANLQTCKEKLETTAYPTSSPTTI
ncbi:MAG: hypothetical protein ACTSUE_00220 [Promethearchaeota archaeon]